MGAEATCTAEYEGRTSDGKALLETDELVFRGAFRLAIPLTQIASVAVAGARLSVTFGGRTAAFALGAKTAATWADKIRSPRGLLDKLGIKPGQRVALAGAFDDDFAASLVARGAKVSSGRVPEGADHLFFLVAKPADLARVPSLAARIAKAGALWLVRVKGKDAPVGERDTMAAGKDAGLVDVKVVRFSATHSAEKFVIPVARR